MDSYADSERIRAEIKKFWGNSGSSTTPGWLEENVPTLMQLGARLGAEPGLKAVQVLLERAIDEHLSKRAGSFKPIWKLGSFIDMSADDRYAAARADLHLSWARIRGNQGDYVGELTDAVMKLIRKAGLTLDTPPPVESEHEPPTGIDRYQLEIAILHQLNARATFVLWGEPGNGKSFAARKVAHAWASGSQSQVLTLSGSPSRGLPNGSYERDLERCLTALNIWPRSTLVQQEAQLRAALEEASGQLVVIFDDLSDESLSGVLPDASAVPIIITRHTRLDQLGADRNLLVSEYTAAEALRAAQAMLPHEEVDHMSLLCELLGQRPEPIDIACRFVQTGRRSLASLVTAMEHSAPSALESIVASQTKTRPVAIFTFYQAVAEQFAGVGLAELMLDCLVWLNEGPTTFTWVVLQVGIDLMNEADALSLVSAWDFAIEIGLLREVGDGTHQMNDLTRDLLRALRVETCYRVLHQFMQAREAYREAGEIRDLRAMKATDRYKIIEFWDLCLSRTFEFCEALFQDEHPYALSIVPLFNQHHVILVQAGINWFAEWPAGTMFVALLELGRRPGPVRMWVPGAPPRDMSVDEWRKFEVAVALFEHLVMNEAFTRNRGYAANEPLIDLHTSGPDGYRHLPLDLLTEDLAFNTPIEIVSDEPDNLSEPEYTTGITIWSFCGKRGTWDTTTAFPLCPKCVEAEQSPDILRRLFDLCSALVAIAILGNHSGADISGLVPRFAAMASRLALRTGQLDVASAYYDWADGSLKVLDESIGLRSTASPLWACLRELRAELDAAAASE